MISPRPARAACEAGGLPAESLDDAIFEFRRFLGLVVVGYPRLPMVSPTIDEVMAAPVCCSAASTRTSASRRWGSSFITSPSWGRPKDAPRQARRDRRKFEQAYTRVYGEMAPWLQPGCWGGDATGTETSSAKQTWSESRGAARSLVETPAPAVREAGTRPLVTPTRALPYPARLHPPSSYSSS